MNEISLQHLTDFNKFGRIIGTAPGCFKSPFMIKPREFLNYAESNLNEGTPHGLLDCLSNTKRAIECQIDCLLIYLGLHSNAKKNNLGFPSKIEILNDAGIISPPRILKKINKTRNLLEHSYQIPNKEKVEDALDVAYLFILSTEKYLNISTYSFDLECGCRCGEEIDTDEYTEQGQPIYDGMYYIKLNPDSRTISVEAHFWEWGTRNRLEFAKKEINFDSGEYFSYLRFFVKLYDLINVR